MRVVWEHVKLIIGFLLIASITTFMALALIPICDIIFNLNLAIFSDKKNDDTFWVFVALVYPLAFFAHIKLSIITLKDLFKLGSLLKHGIFTKAKIISIQETKKTTTFNLQLMHSKYNNVILQKTVPYYKYHKQDKYAKKIQKISIKKYIPKQTDDIPIVKSSLQEDNIYNFNEYNYLKKNSIVPILYNPSNSNDFMICHLWNVWKRNHWLDHYDQDNIDSEKIYKQRTISKSKLFKDILKKYKIILTIALIILAGSLLYIKIFPIIAIIECCLFLMWLVWSHCYFKRHHAFYEYSVATTGTITFCSKIIERKGRYTSIFWEYKYQFIAQNGSPYQGKMKVYLQSNISPYINNSPVTILYDPSCIFQNCIALFYPYSWIQPEEGKNLYRIETIQPDIEESTYK